jgi:hypothetical protein
VNDTLPEQFRHLYPEFVALAVVRAFQWHERNEERTGHKAQSELWVICSALRAELVVRVRDEWCRLAAADPLLFPYNEDAVVRLYTAVRKRNRDHLTDWTARLERMTELRSARPVPDTRIST